MGFVAGLCGAAVLCSPSSVLAQSARAASPDAWAKCPRVAEGLSRIERLNQEASASRELKALRDPERRCAAYGRLIAAAEALLAAAEQTRAAIDACQEPSIPAARRAQLGDMLQLQSSMMTDNLWRMRASRAKDCKGP